MTKSSITIQNSIKMNQSYVKEYVNPNEKDSYKRVVSNPINGAYLHTFPNRQQRRSVLQRPSSNGAKNNSVTIAKFGLSELKYQRIIQRVANVVKDDNGLVIEQHRPKYKHIVHYLDNVQKPKEDQPIDNQ